MALTMGERAVPTRTHMKGEAARGAAITLNLTTHPNERRQNACHSNYAQTLVDPAVQAPLAAGPDQTQLARNDPNNLRGSFFKKPVIPDAAALRELVAAPREYVTRESRKTSEVPNYGKWSTEEYDTLDSLDRRGLSVAQISEMDRSESSIVRARSRRRSLISDDADFELYVAVDELLKKRWSFGDIATHLQRPEMVLRQIHAAGAEALGASRYSKNKKQSEWGGLHKRFPVDKRKALKQRFLEMKKREEASSMLGNQSSDQRQPQDLDENQEQEDSVAATGALFRSLTTTSEMPSQRSLYEQEQSLRASFDGTPRSLPPNRPATP
ncbi:uncharacterized protein LTR77_004758 [Saxophila tyrrhenica]|uniref:Uncharacterized protein n=1 Tax=Saxophila tyrrhenica TaxID=1690608 RepID=A0AAV9PAT0_9PEZI|nr:hypothetical protein LTR77_004758 [Saxophila tyrrhenica]